MQTKLKGRVDAANTVETTTSNDAEKTENDEKTSGTSTTTKVLYTGMEKVLNVLPVKGSKSIAFYISTNTTIATEILEKLANNKSTVYVIHAPSDKLNMEICIRETIASIRRLQPRGPYSLLSIDNESKHILPAIVKQLEHHVQADVTHH